jgi:hypothetical protein
MASTYSPSLKLELIGNGDQSGTWGTTTNNNLGTLLEQAITGVQSIVMTNANYVLTDYNGVSDEARNAVLVVTGSNSAIRQIVCPLVNKLYIIKNATSGGYAITIGGASGSLVTIPNGTTAQVYCDSTNFYSSQTGSAGDFTVNGTFYATGSESLTGNLSVGGTLGVTGTTSLTTGSISGVVTAPTATVGTNTQQIATTAFVQTATAGLGTMATQNANAVNITGGSITGLSSALPVASGGTGVTTSTGSGANVLGTSPTITSPTITSPTITSATLTNPTINGTLTLNASTISSGTALNTTSGTTAGFTGLPSWVKRIQFVFDGQRTTGTSLGLIQVGSGSYATSGYNSVGISNITQTTSSQGFLLSYDWSSTYTRYGIATLDLVTGNTWVFAWQGGDNNSGGGGTRLYTGAGSITLSGTLDRIQVTTVNGTDTFAAGTVNILYE